MKLSRLFFVIKYFIEMFIQNKKLYFTRIDSFKLEIFSNKEKKKRQKEVNKSTIDSSFSLFLDVHSLYI